jgi:hypothetical protein
MHALTNDQLHRMAPSVFASGPDHRVSERYGFVPTIDIITAFQREGWYPVQARQTHVRDASRQALTRHMLRFRRIHDPIQVGDSLAELVLTNSHDRTSAYQLNIGLFRLICSNGMVTSVGKHGGIRVRHGKTVAHEIIDASYKLIEEVPRIAASVDRFREIQLTSPERRAYAEAALVARYGEYRVLAGPVKPPQILEARRDTDTGNDLWTTYNVVQENLYKGGLSGRSRSGRRVKTRAIRSVTEDVRLNRALWRLTERLAELKA